MEKKDLYEIIIQNQKDINSLTIEIQKMQKELEMFSILKKLFTQNSDDSKIKKLEEENKTLKNRYKELEIFNNRLQNEQSQIKTKLQDEILKNKKLEDKNLSLEKELSNNPLQKIEKLYNELNETTKSGIKNILKNQNEVTLFASATLNIEALWEYLRYLRNEHKDKEFKTLQEIVKIILETYTTITDIKYQNVKIGDEFDNEYHTRDNRSEEYDGEIKEILLQGLVENGRVIKKSIVRV
jgi:hypothetical protein